MTSSKPNDPGVIRDIDAVRAYWNTHPLGKQYVINKNLEIGSPEFFEHIRPWMSGYKFPWIMDRIERESKILKGKHLLEIGCGMGFDSVEFLKRGVRVTATDLTPTAVRLAKRHFEIKGLKEEDVRIENARQLSFKDEAFDAVWSRGVLHATGDTQQAISEVHRVLKRGGRAIISHFYRRHSWMYWISKLGREHIEYKEEDPPVNDFLTDNEILRMFEGFRVIETTHDHHRALPVRRSGTKAILYTYGFMPAYNLIPESIARKLAYKLSVTAIKE